MMGAPHYVWRSAVGLVVLAAAAWVWATSAVISNQVRDPESAVSIGVWPQAIAQGRTAANSYARAAAKKPTAPLHQTLTATELALARSSYSSEPLHSRALALIALGKEKQVGLTRASDVYLAAEKLTRRNEIVNIRLMEHHARSSNDEASFRKLDHLMRTNSAALELFVPAMAVALAQPRAVPTLFPVLAAKPDWSVRFWNEVAKRPESHRNASQLRRSLVRLRAGFERPTTTDKALVAAMVGAGNIDSAAAVACSLSRCDNRQSGTRSYLNNGSFGQSVNMVPFDWQTFANGDFGAEVAHRNSTLDISALADTGGLVARQLVQLDAGKYALGWAAKTESNERLGGLRARMVCASDPTNAAFSVAPVRMTARQGGGTFVVPPGCPWYWFSLEILPPTNGDGFDYQLDAITLQRSPKPA